MTQENDASARRYTPADRLIDHVDRALRTVFGRPPTTGRPYPAAAHPEGELDDDGRRAIAGLMRVNHCGEVCAQALYEGQALTARDPGIRALMREASDEENDHLAWCRARLEEVGSGPSRLNPLFYAASLAVGTAAGAAGDRWSLGFLAETERQVVRHLQGHLERIPDSDARSRAIMEQMQTDEAGHASLAVDQGGSELPAPLRTVMSIGSKVMTTTTYWV